MANAELAAEKFLLYFYLVSLDESWAQITTVRALRRLKRKSESGDLSSIIRISVDMAKKNLDSDLPHAEDKNLGQIELPPGSDWGGWFNFRNSVTADERDALLWARILGVPAETVAVGLGISAGTLRHRLSRGLKQLGKILSQGDSHD